MLLVISLRALELRSHCYLFNYTPSPTFFLFIIVLRALYNYRQVALAYECPFLFVLQACYVLPDHRQVALACDVLFIIVLQACYVLPDHRQVALAYDCPILNCVACYQCAPDHRQVTLG